jgi:hypothetical protein
MDVMRKLRVTNSTIAGDKNDALDTSTRREMESSTGAPRVLAAEVYGGGSEYFPFRQLPLWPFGCIRLFAQEED